MREAHDEVIQWIRTEMDLGTSFIEMQQAMTRFGWHPESVAELLLPFSSERAETDEPGASSHVPTPAPDISQLPSTIHCDAREIRVALFVRHPQIVLFSNFLSDEECDELIQTARPRLDRSEIINMDQGGGVVSYSRTSVSMFFRRAETELIERIERRVASLLNWPIHSSEQMQVAHYGPGGYFEHHQDYFEASHATASFTSNGGQRVGTMLLYLNTPVNGGSTIFPDVEIEVMPQRGNALFFGYSRPHSSTRTLHGGAPVLVGEKWLATILMRERMHHCA